MTADDTDGRPGGQPEAVERAVALLAWWAADVVREEAARALRDLEAGAYWGADDAGVA